MTPSLGLSSSVTSVRPPLIVLKVSIYPWTRIPPSCFVFLQNPFLIWQLDILPFSLVEYLSILTRNVSSSKTGAALFTALSQEPRTELPHIGYLINVCSMPACSFPMPTGREKCVAEEQRTLRVKAPGAYLDPRD